MRNRPPHVRQGSPRHVRSEANGVPEEDPDAHPFPPHRCARRRRCRCCSVRWPSSPATRPTPSRPDPDPDRPAARSASSRVRPLLARSSPDSPNCPSATASPSSKLQRILATDKTSWLDKDGKLFYREPVAAAKERRPPRRHRGGPPRAVAAATGPAFELHSRPGSNRVDLPGLRRPHHHRYGVEPGGKPADRQRHAVRHRRQHRRPGAPPSRTSYAMCGPGSPRTTRRSTST